MLHAYYVVATSCIVPVPSCLHTPIQGYGSGGGGGILPDLR